MVLKWNKVTGAKSYGIQVQYGGVNGELQIRWRNIRATQFTISRWGGNFGYRMRVFASTGDGTVAAQNSAYSSWTGWFYTPPKTPTLLKAVAREDGVNVSWSRSGSYYQQGTELACSDGRSWLLGNGTSGKAPTSYLDAGAAGTGLQYRVRGFVGGTGTGQRVFSAWTGWSAKVERLVAPNPPTLVGPTGIAPAYGATVLKWKASPKDGSAQTGAEVRWRKDGGAWTTKTVSGSAQTYSAGTLTAGGYEWQARTKALSGEFGDWSDVGVFVTADRPTVTLAAPANNTSKLAVSWTTTQEQSLPQSEARVTLLQGGNVLEQKLIKGAGSKTTFKTVLVNDTAYEVQVQVTCSGLVSELASKSFTTSFIPPAVPVLSAVWDDSLGAHIVTVKAGSGGSKATTSLTLQRDTGTGWVTVAENLRTTEQEIVDFEGKSNGDTTYRLTAYTSEDATAQRTVTIDADSQAAWVASGDSLDQPLRLIYQPSLGVDVGRERSTQAYAGRELPVAYAGEHVTRKITVSGLILVGDEANSTVQALRELAESPSATVFYRDPTGHHLFGVISDTKLEYELWGGWNWSATITETDTL